ncbi:unnamed protein product [Sphagnum jensenii]|uniref:Cytochrome P450 n=1 Tax=Sphagnum jensenii TaxID=128206 RepID=A0ABP1ADE6_9BRYO
MYTVECGITELIRNSMVMKRAQTELETVVGTNRIVEEADLHKLTYLQAVVKEILRLHPPGPLLLPHGSLDEACQVAGCYDTPPRTKVLLNIWAMGQDPSIWERPLEFYPERFLQQQQQQQHPDALKYDLQPNFLQQQHPIVDKTVDATKTVDVKENTFEHFAIWEWKTSMSRTSYWKFGGGDCFSTLAPRLQLGAPKSTRSQDP